MGKYWTLWNYDLLWKKSMVLYKKLWIWYGKNDGTTVTCIPKTMELWFAAKKKYGAIPKTLKLWLTMEKTLWRFTKKLWKIDLPWEKLCYYTKIYDLIYNGRYMVLLYQKIWYCSNGTIWYYMYICTYIIAFSTLSMTFFVMKQTLNCNVLRGGEVSYSVRRESGSLGVRIPATTEN